jgi:hypothetical protein
MFHTKLPFVCAKNMLLMYVWFIFKHQQKFLGKYACDMYDHAFPSSWIDSNVSLKWKQWKSQECTLPGSHHFEGARGACWSSEMGLGRMTSTYSLTRTCTKPNNKLVSALLEHFGVRMSHEQIWIHKTHHNSDLGEVTTFPLIVYYVPLHEAHIQVAFWPGNPKWESWNFQSWDPHHFGVP